MVVGDVAVVAGFGYVEEELWREDGVPFLGGAEGEDRAQVDGVEAAGEGAVAAVGLVLEAALVAEPL